ncbi:MAG: hypothetical protein WBA97_06040 [Actinophytocola sp.]|uniref:hypothetical protein n=1 Tax=Actinophytocola sp. TaxID=1872138 RepID=UPI003C70FAC2
MVVTENHVDPIDVVVVDVRTGDRARLQAADVIIGQRRSRRGARRWVESIRRQFPGCVVAVSWSRRGRWMVLGWPGPAIHLPVGSSGEAHAAEVGRLVYQLWICGVGGRS